MDEAMKRVFASVLVTILAFQTLFVGVSADTRPALSTVHINAAAIGRQAAQFIVDRAEGRLVDPRVIDIGFSIVERDST